MDFETSETKKNLQTAYLKESGAYNEYTYYAEQAKQEGYEQIYNTFNTFAHNEQEHAKIWFKLWHGISCTQDNLKDAMDLENYERSVMYADFANKAREEGFNDIAELFDGVAAIERAHEERYKTFLNNVKNKTVFSSIEEVNWICLNCGHVHKGTTPPEKCPVCSHPQAYFMIQAGQN